MSEVKKIATRDSYGNALAQLGTEHPEVVVLDADLAAATKTGTFKKAHPERFIDCGIAESNMIGVAAGLAAAGKVPFASSFAMFAAGRAFEQIRNSVGYPHLNVKIGATHAGISVGEDGATHQCNEDIALMRTIPGMVVINPSDDVEAKAAVKAAYEHVGPVYLRFGRLAVPVINDNAEYKFEIGKAITLREGTDVTIIAIKTKNDLGLISFSCRLVLFAQASYIFFLIFIIALSIHINNTKFDLRLIPLIESFYSIPYINPVRFAFAVCFYNKNVLNSH